MRDLDEEYSVFQKALKIEDPWYVIDYNLNQKDQILDVYLDFKRGAAFSCPDCGASHAKVHDIVDDDRTWRHMDFWQYKTSFMPDILEFVVIRAGKSERLS